MRVLVQRVSQASITVDDVVAGSIGPGLLLLVGITGADTDRTLRLMTDKVANLRIFEDDQGRMNLSALDRHAKSQHAGVLVISQFTLYGDVRKGRRPSFVAAAPPDQAAPMIEAFAAYLGELGLEVESGVFGAQMMVCLVNDGPVTIWIDSDDLRRPHADDMSGT
ncbi:D-aminoacyl-tRNA deacylase [soil metagenome]